MIHSEDGLRWPKTARLPDVGLSETLNPSKPILRSLCARAMKSSVPVGTERELALVPHKLGSVRARDSIRLVAAHAAYPTAPA